MRLAFIGCVEASAAALARLLEIGDPAQVVGVVTRDAAPANHDFRSLRPLAERAGLPCLSAHGDDQVPLASFLRELAPDVVYCIGWSRLLRREVLAVPPLGVVGWHPAALPRNRGRHPIVWALALGLTETASSFFFLDEGVDSGDLLSQVTVPIRSEDDAGTLYARLVEIALGQIEAFTPQLAAGTCPRVPQDPTRANLWRKRSYADGRIDWRMSARAVHDLVRALARPYAGAHCALGGRDCKVWRSALAADFAPPPNLEPGRVLAVEGELVVVRCGEGAVRLIEHEIAPLPAPGSWL